MLAKQAYACAGPFPLRRLGPHGNSGARAPAPAPWRGPPYTADFVVGFGRGAPGSPNADYRQPSTTPGPPALRASPGLQPHLEANAAGAACRPKAAPRRAPVGRGRSLSFAPLSRTIAAP